MRITDIIYLGWTNLRSHFGRNLLTMGIIGVLFCLIFSVQLWFQGLENYYLAYAGANINGAVIISTNPQIPYADNYDSEGNYIPEMLSLEEIAQDITIHGGTILDTTNSEVGLVLPRSLVSSTIPTDIPIGVVPILLHPEKALHLTERECPSYFNSVASKIRFYQDIRAQIIGKTFEENGVKYFPIDFSTNGFCSYTLSFNNLDRNNYSILNPLLDMLITPNSETIIIDGFDSLPYSDDQTSIIAIFSDTATAYRYLMQGRGLFSMVEIPEHEVEYSVSTIAGTSPEIMFIFRLIHFFLNIGCLILVVIAIIIIVFTSIRLIDQDKRIIRLYHSFGATKRQVQLVYLAYFLELMIGTIILSFGLASLITVLYSFCNQANLSALFVTGFSLAEVPTIILWGMNPEIFLSVSILLLLAPLSIFVNNKRF